MTVAVVLDLGLDWHLSTQGEQRVREIIKWLRTNVGFGGIYDPIMVSDYRWSVSGLHLDRLLVTFKKSSDAVLFKLTWGGQI